VKWRLAITERLHPRWLPVWAWTFALKLAKPNQTVVNQNLALSAVAIDALLVGAVAGWFTLPTADLGHEISESVVIGSGLRMLRS